VVFDVDFATGFFDEAFDILAARSDERADLFRIDLERLDARGVFADVRARRGDDLGHLSENVHAGDARLLDRLGHDMMRNSGELQVELEAGNAFFRAGNFAVHVAEPVFPADDVGEKFVLRNLLVAAVYRADTNA